MLRRYYCLLLTVLTLFVPMVEAGAVLYVSEIMADNDNTLSDENGDSSDWIELYNDSTNAVSLEGWCLTDNPTNLTQWSFPAIHIPAKGFLLVYASGKDRAGVGQELHTNFQLSNDGEYVALVRPDGITVESSFSFPAQLEDISWGYAFSGNATTSTATLVETGDACTAHVPTNATDGVGWMDPAFDDSGWLTGSTGAGYERSSGYESLIGLDVESGMYNRNGSVYMRIPFVYNGGPHDTLRLRMKYDDGFVAYLNGTRIAAANAPSTLSWNSISSSSRGGDEPAMLFQNFDSSAYAGALQSGNNVLAIHGLNTSTTSSDALFLPELDASLIDSGPVTIIPAERGMLSFPTPGSPNAAVNYSGYCETPAVYPEHGFYDAPFHVAISNVTEGAVVRYTTDGSAPTESSALYTEPIPVDGTTLLRAAAFKETFKPSPPQTQTYLFITEVLQQDGSGLPPAGNWGHAGPDWAVDPTMTHTAMTDSYGQSFQLADALLDIPTVSLVTDWDYWWSDEAGPTLPDGVTPWLGIYADPVGENAVRRPVSMEYFTPDGSKSFSEPGVVSIVGGGIGGTSAWRWKTDKLSMRVAFTEKLNYPVFGEDAAGKFNGLVLDAHLGFTWSTTHSLGQRTHPKYLTDAVASDLQNGMSGKGAPHGHFVHLYLNGLYWGLYDMHERPDEHFAAEYFGGENEDYDSVKHWSNDSSSADSDHDGDPYNDNLTNGDDADLNALLAYSRSGLSTLERYQTMDAWLDIDGLIDYLLVNFFLGNNDWAHKNWYVTHNRTDPDGRWRYHSWDVEHVYEVSTSNFDVSGAVFCDVTGKSNSGGPTEIHQDLTANAEYRLRFADHMHRHFFNDGILTPDVAKAVFWNRVLEMEEGMLGEAARWADNVSNEEHDWQEWYDHMTDLRDLYYPNRSGAVFNQLKSRGLYPDTPAPEFRVNGRWQHGGLITPTDSIIIDSSHTVYYTTDGTDPRATGGAAAGTLYSGPLAFNKPTLLKARAKNGDEWSALCEAVFWTDDIPLAVTELMYHAAAGNLQDFIEIRNVSAETVSPNGYKLDNAVDFHFGETPLAPGEYMVVIKDIDGFSTAYNTNGITIAGEYKGDFDNSGEKVDLEFHNRDLVSFRYSDARNWPQAADGAGHSLVPLDSAIDDEERGSLNYGGNWRASTFIGGSPGTADPEPVATVLLNEIVAHTDTGEDPPFDSNDQIELYNPTAASITLTGWFLSDDIDEPEKWPIPDGTMIPALGFVTFNEDDFHPGRASGFGIDKAGEQVVLSAPGRVVDVIRFKGQENGVSLGRYPDGSTDWLVTLPTPDAPNQLAALDVWISALMYNPPAPAGYADGDMVEYIQLENRSMAAVPFENEVGTWRIDGGVDFDFPSGFLLPAGEKLWLVSFDPADTTLLNLFCSTYGLNAGEETILGPYRNQLSNEGERVALERPQASDDPLKPYDISWVVVDELFYFDQAPWSGDADGTGYPLVRNGLTGWGVPTEGDTDADQLDDAWENSHFGSLAQNGDDDPDNDRFNNYEESIAGTIPTNGASYLMIDTIAAPSIEWTAVTGRTYSVYWTDNLSRPFVELTSGIAYPQNSYTDTQHSTNNANYYYIAVERE